MTYRKIYVERLKEELPLEWDIHHLDRNPKNNNFSNLVALPKRLHVKYHYLLKQVEINYNQVCQFSHIKNNLDSFGVPYDVEYQRTVISNLNNNIINLQQVEKQIMHYVAVRNKKAELTLKELFGGTF